MKDIIKLNPHAFLKKKVQSDKCKTYKLITPYPYRMGETEDNRTYVDPSGGPFIVEGDKISDKYTIKSIKGTKEGIFIEFE